MFDQPDDEQRRKQQAIADLLAKLNPPKPVDTSTQAGDLPTWTPGELPAHIGNGLPPTPGLRSPMEMNASGVRTEGLPDVTATAKPIAPQFNPLDGVVNRAPGMPAPTPMPGRETVPVPYIEGERHKPGITTQPYTRDKAERFDFYNSGVLPPDKMRAAEIQYQASRPNNFDSDPNTPGVQPWTFGKRLKAGLMPALVGGLQGIAQAAQNPRNNWKGVLAGGVGGGGAALAMGAANPEAGSSYLFNQFEKPRLLEEEARRKADEDRALKQQELRLQMGHLGAQIDLNKAQTENYKTDNALAADRFKADIEMKRSQQALETWKAQHPGRAPYADAQGYARDTVTNQIITDPQTQQPVKMPPKDTEHFSYSPEYGAYSTKTGKPIAGTASQKLAPADEKALEGHAEALVSKAFPPDHVQSLLKSYSDAAYRTRISPEDEKKAAGSQNPKDSNYDPYYDPKNAERINRARAEADKEARATLERESGRWKQLFHDALRRFAQNGQPIPSGGMATPDQVHRLAEEKNISEDDAVRFLGAFGTKVVQPGGTQQLFNQSKQGWNK